MNKRQKKIIIAILSLIVGCICGTIYAKLDFNGYFVTRWQAIENPPFSVQKLVGLSEDTLWIQSTNGQFYYISNSSSCKKNCWKWVAQLPAFPIKDFPQEKITDKPCVLPLPILGVKEKIAQCRYNEWSLDNYIFVLRTNNSIFLWQSRSYTEWSAVMLFIDDFIGATSLFLLTLLIFLIFAIYNRLKKSRDKNEN